MDCFIVPVSPYNTKSLYRVAWKLQTGFQQVRRWLLFTISPIWGIILLKTSYFTEYYLITSLPDLLCIHNNVQNQLVRDVKAPLLRVVPVKNENVNYVHYNRPHFIPVSRSDISVFEVNIRDERVNNVLLMTIILWKWVWIEGVSCRKVMGLFTKSGRRDCWRKLEVLLKAEG